MVIISIRYKRTSPIRFISHSDLMTDGMLSLYRPLHLRSEIRLSYRPEDMRSSELYSTILVCGLFIATTHITFKLVWL